MLIFALAYWGRNFSFVFLKKPKNPFEINWPLVYWNIWQKILSLDEFWCYKNSNILTSKITCKLGETNGIFRNFEQKICKIIRCVESAADDMKKKSCMHLAAKQNKLVSIIIDKWQVHVQNLIFLIADIWYALLDGQKKNHKC